MDIIIDIFISNNEINKRFYITITGKVILKTSNNVYTKYTCRYFIYC